MDRARASALEALSLMRSEGWSLTRSSKAVGLKLRDALEHIAPALEKHRGRYVPKPYDRLSRPMRLLTPRGIELVEVRDSRTAEKLGRYWNALDRYLKTGDAGALRGFEGMTFQSRGETYGFLTDRNQLKRLALAGEVRFEDIYDLTRG